jgi:PPOX class probable FMN-dependent enzyme
VRPGTLISMDLAAEHLIHHEHELSELYGPPLERSVRKQLDRLDEYSRAFIAASPFLVIGTQGGEVADNSPRGDVPGFVQVEDDHTLLIPDRRGNNRLDTLRNILRNPSVGLLFLVPGIQESFRVNGVAVVSRDPALVGRFAVEGKTPRTVLVVTVKEAYVHCSRALLRAGLWNPAKFAAAGTVPSFGTMMAAHTCGFVDAKTVDEDAKVRMPLTLY